jgi:hypothetical protein
MEILNGLLLPPPSYRDFLQKPPTFLTILLKPPFGYYSDDFGALL